MIFSTWRTLVPTLEDRPLALCDSRSVEPKDLVAADRIIPDRVGEVYYLTHNPNHRWYVAKYNGFSHISVITVIGTGWRGKRLQNHSSLSCMTPKMETTLDVSCPFLRLKRAILVLNSVAISLPTRLLRQFSKVKQCTCTA